jgi:hypothetical protein
LHHPSTLTAYASTQLQALSKVQHLQEDARLLAADDLLTNVESIVHDPKNEGMRSVKVGSTNRYGVDSPCTPRNNAVFILMLQDARRILEENRMSFDLLRNRAEECRGTLQEWEDPDWKLSQTFQGISTWYKHDVDDGSLWVKLRGVTSDVPLFEQLVTVREVDLFSLWVPFCSKSYLLQRIALVELLGYFCTSIPGVSRDAVLHAYACDATLEDDCILIQARSVQEWAGVDLPKEKDTSFHKRMTVHGFKARIDIMSPTSVSTSLVANVDPNMPLPQWLIDFVMKHMAAVVLSSLLKAARKISENPNSLHRRRIIADKDFYKDWALPRLMYYYAVREWPLILPEYFQEHALTVRSDSGHDGGELHPRGHARKRTFAAFRGIGPRLHGLPVRLQLSQTVRNPFVRGRGTSELKQTISAVPDPPSLEELDVDPRLLEKWKTWADKKREMKAQGSQPPAGAPVVLRWSSWAAWSLINLALFLTPGAVEGLHPCLSRKWPIFLVLEASLRVAVTHKFLLFASRAVWDVVQDENDRRLDTLQGTRAFVLEMIKPVIWGITACVWVYSLLRGTGSYFWDCRGCHGVEWTKRVLYHVSWLDFSAFLILTAVVLVAKRLRP